MSFIFNDLSKRPLPRPRLAPDRTTRNLSTSVYFGQTRPRLETTRAIDWHRSSRSRPGSRSTTMRTLPLLYAIKGSYHTGHVDDLMATIQPMHPERVMDVFAHFADETGRRLQDPASGARHVFVHVRFVFGSMVTDDTHCFVNHVDNPRRRTQPTNHFRTFL